MWAFVAGVITAIIITVILSKLKQYVGLLLLFAILLFGFIAEPEYSRLKELEGQMIELQGKIDRGELVPRLGFGECFITDMGGENFSFAGCGHLQVIDTCLAITKGRQPFVEEWWNLGKITTETRYRFYNVPGPHHPQKTGAQLANFLSGVYPAADSVFVWGVFEDQEGEDGFGERVLKEINIQLSHSKL